MRIATVEEARRIDALSQKEGGLSAEVLVEAAGALAAREIFKCCARKIPNAPVLVLCGPGHNGADGLVVARHLHGAGLNVIVGLTAPESLSKLTTLELKRTRLAGVAIEDASADFVPQAALIVDAIFGIGLRAPLDPGLCKLVERINASESYVVSVDTPTGLDADRGVALGVAIRADLTLTFAVAKRGFFVSDGPDHVGRLKVIPIGFPRSIMLRETSSHRLITSATARRLLPNPQAQSNKSTQGRAGIIGGRPGMNGALLLAARAAARAGAGYVIASSFGDPSEIVKTAPEFLTLSADDRDLWTKGRFTAVGIGPGLGVGQPTEDLLRALMKEKIEKVVVDADALTVIAQSKLKLPSTWIATPHAGELARLIGKDASYIEANRFACAREGARKLGCILVLKGFRTVVDDGERTAVIGSGNAALAKAGSGDVLTGIITGFLAQGLVSFDAAVAAAFVHGHMADEWLRSGRDQLSLEPSDLIEALPHALGRLRRSEGDS